MRLVSCPDCGTQTDICGQGKNHLPNLKSLLAGEKQALRCLKCDTVFMYRLRGTAESYDSTYISPAAANQALIPSFSSIKSSCRV